MLRTLVVYYSRTGITNRVAKYLAQRLGAELDPIQESRPRHGVAGYLRSITESAAKGLPIITTRFDPSDFDLVVVGTPVWVGNMCSPVRSYLLTRHAQLPSCAFFATMGGSGGEQTVREMALAGASGPHAETLVLRQHQVEQGHFEAACNEFAAALLRMPLEPRHKRGVAA